MTKALIFLTLLWSSFAMGQDIWMTPNQGQWDSRVDYAVDVAQGKLYLEQDGMCFFLTDAMSHNESHGHTHEAEESKHLINYHAIKQNFIGAQSSIHSVNGKSDYYKNYLIGNDPTKWKKNVFSYNEVSYPDVYEGIDLIYLGQKGQLSYNFLVKPGSNSSQIAFNFEGANSVHLQQEELIIAHRFGQITQSQPKAWEIDENGKKKKVRVQYHITNDVISFKFPEGYDSTKQLYIDPSLTFSTFSGSTIDNWGFTATPDIYGNLFGGGIVFGSGYPVTTGSYDNTFNSGTGSFPMDVAISKYNTDGTSLLYATYVGGSGNETPHSIVCADNGELFIYGITSSTDFPMAGNPFDNSFNGGPSQTENSLSFNGTDIYIARLSADGSNLLASTYVGGSDSDGLNTGNLHYNYGDQFRGEITIDGNGDVYVSSTTYSSDFPVNNPVQSFLNGSQDAILMKLPPLLNTLTWCTYFGGSGIETGNAVQVNDALGAVCIAGGTNSNSLPVSSGNDLSFNGGISDGYVAKFNSTTGAVSSGTYMGLGEYDQTYFVQFDVDDAVYVYGQTESAWPITPGCFGSANSGQFIRKYDSNLNTIEWTTMIGAASGHVEISPTAFLVSDCYDIYMAGWGGTLNSSGSASFSTTNGFLVTNDAHQNQTNGSNFYIAVLDENAQNMKYATFMGGMNSSSNHVDGGTSRFDKSGRIYHAVCAACGGNNFGFTSTTGSYAEENLSPNCNMATFKFELSSIEAAAAQPAPLICIPQSVLFLNDSQNGNAYIWDFGDGNTSTEEEPIYQYTEPGSYEVQLIVYDTTGCYSSDSVSLIVDIGAFSGGVVDPIAPICPGGSYQLEAFGGQFYEWTPSGLLDDPSSPSPTATIDQTTTFSVTVSDTCGSETLQVTLEVYNNPVSISPDNTICIGNSTQLEVFGSGTVEWSPPLFLDDPNSFTPVCTPDSSITYIATVTTADGCVNEDTTTVTVFFDPPSPVMDDEVELCLGAQTSISVSGGDYYNWINDPYIVSSDESVAVINPSINQWFYVEVGNACGTIIDSIYANVIEIEITAGNDTIICPTEVAYLWAEGATYYEWQPSNTVVNQFGNEATVIPNSSTNYTVIGIDDNGCYDTAYVYVALFPYPSFDVSNDVIAFYGDEIQLEAYSDQPGAFVWSPAEYLSCIHCHNPIATPNQEITYEVSFTDLNGCSSEEYITITYDAVVYVPNTFTPDNDGMNDVFEVSGGNLLEMKCLIFNRWGQLIHTMNSPNESWNGTFNGAKCQDGTYIWKLIYTDFTYKEYELSGHVNLIR